MPPMPIGGAPGLPTPPSTATGQVDHATAMTNCFNAKGLDACLAVGPHCVHLGGLSEQCMPWELHGITDCCDAMRDFLKDKAHTATCASGNCGEVKVESPVPSPAPEPPQPPVQQKQDVDLAPPQPAAPPEPTTPPPAAPQPPPPTATTTPPPAAPQPTPTTTTTPAPAGPVITPSQFVFGVSGGVTHRPKKVNYKQTESAIPILGALTFNGPHTAIPRILKFTDDSMNLKVDEPPCYDGKHMKEAIPYLVDTPGVHETDEGVRYYVGKTTYKQGKKGGHFDFPEKVFDTDDIAVFLSPLTRNGVWYAARVKEADKDHFDFAVEPEDSNDKHDADEEIGFLAIPVSDGKISGKKYVVGSANNVRGWNKGRKNRNKYTEIKLGKPYLSKKSAVFGSIMTKKGPDTATLRMKKFGKRGKVKSLRMKIHEPDGRKCKYHKSAAHMKEQVAYMIIEQ